MFLSISLFQTQTDIRQVYDCSMPLHIYHTASQVVGFCFYLETAMDESFTLSYSGWKDNIKNQIYSAACFAKLLLHRLCDLHEHISIQILHTLFTLEVTYAFYLKFTISVTKYLDTCDIICQCYLIIFKTDPLVREKNNFVSYFSYMEHWFLCMIFNPILS